MTKFLVVRPCPSASITGLDYLHEYVMHSPGIISGSTWESTSRQWSLDPRGPSSPMISRCTRDSSPTIFGFIWQLVANNLCIGIHDRLNSRASMLGSETRIPQWRHVFEGGRALVGHGLGSRHENMYCSSASVLSLLTQQKCQSSF